MTGQISMIKYICVIFLFVQSCAYIDYSNLPSAVNKLFVGVKDFKISQEYYETRKFSFAKVRVGRSGASIFVLSEIRPNSKYVWISEDNERLITKNGKIIALYSDPEFSFNLLEELAFNYSENLSALTYLIKFHHPEAFFEQTSSLDLYKENVELYRLGETVYVNQFNERVTTNKLRWNFINTYQLNNRGVVLQSEQYIHPNLPKISIEYYFKY